MSFYSVFMTTLIFSPKFLQSKSLTCAQSAALFRKSPKSLFDSSDHDVIMIHINKYRHNQPKKPEIHIDEPCRVNPCSQESVYDVMNHIENICLVGANDHTNFKCYFIYSCIRYSRFCILSKYGMEVDRKGISSPKEIQITPKSLCV